MFSVFVNAAQNISKWMFVLKDLQRFTRYIKIRIDTKYSTYTQNVESIGHREQSKSQKSHHHFHFHYGLYNLIKRRPYLTIFAKSFHEYSWLIYKVSGCTLDQGTHSPGRLDQLICSPVSPGLSVTLTHVITQPGSVFWIADICIDTKLSPIYREHSEAF